MRGGDLVRSGREVKTKTNRTKRTPRRKILVDTREGVIA